MTKRLLSIFLTPQPTQQDKTKHVEVDKHFIKEKIEIGQIVTPFVSTKQQLADVYTRVINNTFNSIRETSNSNLQAKKNVR